MCAAAFLASLLLAQPLADPRPPPLTLRQHGHMALVDLQSVPAEDQYFTRYFSLALAPAKDRAEFRRAFTWWLSQITFEKHWYAPRQLDGGNLLCVDLRNYRWTVAGWNAVVDREPYCEEPAINSDDAAELRRLTGYTISEKAAKAQRAPVGAMLSAAWVFRETIESARSPSYYDFLFSQQRHPDGYEQPTHKAADKPADSEPFEHPGGDYSWPDGAVTRNMKAGWYRKAPDGGIIRMEMPPAKKAAAAPAYDAAKFIDFPRDETDWNDIFGLADGAAFLKKQKIRLDFGMIAPGARDDPKGGSIVTWNNRVLVFIRTLFGIAMKSIDVSSTAKLDFLQNQVEVAMGQVKGEAGELLATLPNGGQAAMLINGQGKRIEQAGLDFARNSLDLDHYPDVRTAMGCVGCHAPEGGVIAPRNLVQEAKKKGITIKKLDRDRQIELDRFFEEQALEEYRLPYLALIEKTANFGQKDKWKPADLQAAFLRQRNLYDEPVTPEVCAAEQGVDPITLKLALVRSPLIRAGLLVQDEPVPRSLWEAELYRETSRLLALPRMPLPWAMIRGVCYGNWN